VTREEIRASTKSPLSPAASGDSVPQYVDPELHPAQRG
jgi:hypothetical protein